MPLNNCQKTISKRIDMEGIGVHNGQSVNLSLVPAGIGTGIMFHRVDLDEYGADLICALSNNVGATDLCTVIGDCDGAKVQTIEHLMAALSALNVDNLIVEIDSPEVPVMDGSAKPFVDAILKVGLEKQMAPRRVIKVLKPVRVAAGGSWAEFVPAESRQFDVEIDFESEAIGRQRMIIDLDVDDFYTQIAAARTFGFMKDVERLWAAGYALGSSLDNSVVICDNHNIVNPEGLRFSDEFVRHKLLDAIGDLSLAGHPIVGCYRSYRGGHNLNSVALNELLADKTNYELIDQTALPVLKKTKHNLKAISF